jgi:hypothetical protein
MRTSRLQEYVAKFSPLFEEVLLPIPQIRADIRLGNGHVQVVRDCPRCISTTFIAWADDAWRCFGFLIQSYSSQPVSSAFTSEWDVW